MHEYERNVRPWPLVDQLCISAMLGSYAIASGLFILSSLLLVPRYHAEGAATSYVIGMIAQALLIALSLFFSPTQSSTNTETGRTTS